ncbi:MAG: hypothetical protein AB8F94_05775 [Saprospiraceae bacterium]
MLKVKIFTFFLTLCFVPLLAQNYNVDELQEQLSTASSDKIKIETFIELINAYASIDIDSSIFYFEEALQLAKKNNNHESIIQIQDAISETLMVKGAYTKAKIIIDEAILLGNQLQNDTLICSNLMNLGTWHWAMSNSKQYFEVLNEALEYANKANSIKHKAMIYASYGIFYGEKADIKREREYLQKSLQIFRQNKDTNNQIILLQNLSDSYFNDNDFSTALEYINQAIKLIKTTNNTGILYQHVLGFKGAILYHLGETELGFSILDSVLILANSDNNSRIIILINNEKSKWLLEDHRYDEAIKSADIGVQLCKKTGYMHQLPELCNTLSQAFKAKKDFESALFWINEKTLANEEIRTRQQNKELSLLEANHELLQKETENQILTLENSNQRMLIVFTTILGFLLSFFAYYYFRKKHQKNLEKLRQKIAADLHDDVGSNLNNIARIAKRLKTSNNLSEINKGIDNLVKRSNEAILNIVDVIWTLDSEESELSNLIEKMESYLDKVKANDENVKINLIKNNLDLSTSLTINMRHHLLMIFKEAVNNIQKHTVSSKIEIKLSNDNNFSMSFFNEFGEKKESLNSTNRGIPNIKNRVAELKGKVNIKETSTSYFLQIELNSLT